MRLSLFSLRPQFFALLQSFLTFLMVLSFALAIPEEPGKKLSTYPECWVLLIGMSSGHKRSRRDVGASDSVSPAKRLQVDVDHQYAWSPTPSTQRLEIEDDIEMKDPSTPDSTPKNICYGTVSSMPQLQYFLFLDISEIPRAF